MNKASISAFLVVAFLIVSCDVVESRRSCKTTPDCRNMEGENRFPTCVCVDGTCVCFPLNTYSIDHEDNGSGGKGSCKSRADCHMKCESGLPTCVGGVCVCLAPKTYSIDHKDT
ncbi:hypothetical protein RND71_002841 [Anisodus tanguticus]|uniref:Uncharacterized protein n=1 Tax=Anisodus tanguticus TaxID=243964 RepID=A0AAE1SUX4_9SOLA|nr:hypothetical protein RND71_002841 [Anisodus tanguticus]